MSLAGCAGMWSVVPGDQVIDAPSEDAEPFPERPVGPTDYLVRQGDTVYSIAFRNQIDYRELAEWNRIGPDYLIYPGQVLRLTSPPLTSIGAGDIKAAPIDVAAPGKPVPLGDSAPAPVEVTPVPTAVAGSSVWQWPTDGVVIRGYAPAQGAKGLDFTGDVGQPIYAAAPGKVVYSGSALKGYGELIIVKHDSVRLSAYGYNRSRLVKEGDVVTSGQKIAEMGLGPENQPVLHFEIREKGTPINPVPFLPARASASP